MTGSARRNPLYFAGPFCCIAGRLAPSTVSPLIPSAPLTAELLPSYCCQRNSHLGNLLSSLKHTWKSPPDCYVWSFRQIWNITQTDMHLLWHDYLGDQRVHTHVERVCVSLYPYGTADISVGLQVYWFFLLLLFFTLRRKDSSSLEKKKNQAINRNCAYCRISCFQQPCFSGPQTKLPSRHCVPRTTKSKNLWLLGTQTVLRDAACCLLPVVPFVHHRQRGLSYAFCDDMEESRDIGIVLFCLTLDR